MVAAWSGVGCLPCRLDKANCCCLSLSLTLSLDPCSIPPRPVRPNQTETFKQSQRPTKASQMRAGLFRARKRRAWPYPIWHIQYIPSVRIHHIVYRIHMYYMAWAAIKITRCLSIFGTPTRYGFPLQSPAIELNFLLLIIIQNSPAKSATTKSTQKNVTSTGEINFREGFVVVSRFSFNRVSIPFVPRLLLGSVSN